MSMEWLSRKTPGWLASAVLVGLWLYLYRAVFPYFAVIFTREEFRTNQVVLLAAVALIVLQVRKGGLALHLDELPRLHPAALALALSGSAAYLLAERFLDINTLSSALFGLASYGLLGLWMDPFAWRQGFLAALLLVGALPFGEHMQTFVGYPVRVLTAEAVRGGFSAFGIHSLGVDTILVFENGVSKVDLPCSGVKSLWTGGVFFLAATWIERRALNLRWLLAGCVFALALLLANLVRVALLVGVGEVAGWRLLAEMLHVPSGVLGFVAACGLGLLLLRFAGSLPGAPETRETAPARRPLWLAPVLALTLGVLGVLYTPRLVTAAPAPPLSPVFPSDLVTEDWPLSPGEQAWLAEAGVQSARRWHFTAQPAQDTGSPFSGSMLVVASDSWRAHHRPERCFEVYGLTVDQSATLMAAADFPLRGLWLSTSREKNRMTAVYWLQAGSQVTDDYATRIWADLSPQRQRWVLVTILFDGPVDPGSLQATRLYRQLRSVFAEIY